ncbi:chemotaxis protein CheW [Maridesulfovibrio zosterae]|uniref:chemotaxis protein CheW n=1 Tax=Maridesulfovibrio zosterae TaxID=82171 RepID=UPI0003F714B1|nr:chemotaxis protein CheW [Maridesulfovibrio zosterae]
MNENDYVILDVEACKFAIPSVQVDKVERAVLLTHVPDAPEPVLGVISDGGRVIPVLGLRKKLGLQERDVILSDRLLFSECNGRKIAILVDNVSAVVEIEPGLVRVADEIWPGVVFLKSLAGVDEDVVLVQDLGAVLDVEQGFKLDAALKAMRDLGDIEADGE